MAAQDTHVRYTIRVPAALYERLQASAGEKSVNAEIIARLSRSFDLDDEIGSLQDQLAEQDETLDTHGKKIEWLEGQIWRLLELTGNHDPNPD